MSDRSERMAAAVIILCATLLCAMWSLRVPMFQEPDEIAHADASFLYFDVGTTFSVPHAATANFVEPETRYLMDAVAYRHLRYDDRAAVPKGYGTRAYFRDLDHGAPTPTSTVQKAGIPLPYVLAFYPSTYYCEVATAMRAGWVISGHSLSAAFFAGRLLNVAMLSATLILAYFIFREVPFSSVQRLALLGGVAFFPLSTWMGAYIQPDNQSALFMVATLLATLILRRNPRSLAALFFFATSLSLLGVTKVQYALAAFVGCGLALRNAFDAEPSAVRRRAYAIGIAAPLLAMLAGHYLSPIGRLDVLSRSSAYSHIGVVETLRVVGSHFLHGIVDAFLGGPTFGGFWFRFGIRGAGAYSDHLAEAATSLLIVATLAVATAWIVVLLRTGRRLRLIGKRHGLARALTFVGNDASVNLYVLLSMTLFALHTFTGGDLALQGRYWYPVLIPIVVMSVRAVGMAFPRAYQGAATSVACVSWLSYSLVSAPAAVTAMERNFYGRHDDGPTFAVGKVESATVGGRQTAFDDVAIPAGTSVTVRGDALDTSTGLPAVDVRYRIDRGPECHARARLRDDALATRFNDDMLNDAGFRFVLGSTGLAPGPHRLTIAVRDRRESTLLPLASLRFFVVGSVESQDAPNMPGCEES